MINQFVSRAHRAIGYFNTTASLQHDQFNKITLTDARDILTTFRCNRLIVHRLAIKLHIKRAQKAQLNRKSNYRREENFSS